MNFKDTGIILSVQDLQEKSKIICLFTENHGLIPCVIRANQKKSSIYQAGQLVNFEANLKSQNSLCKISNLELIKSYAHLIMESKYRLYAFNSIISVIKLCFKEHIPHNDFFMKLHSYIQNLSNDPTISFINYIKFELEILSSTGYGLMLHECCVNGSNEQLIYVSPKSGCAVSASAGNAYADKLLKLPQFLVRNLETEITNEDKQDAFNLTNYFFKRYLFAKDIDARTRFACIYHIFLKGSQPLNL
jgi:DNA repair protein RecO (recombination protein O)